MALGSSRQWTHGSGFAVGRPSGLAPLNQPTFNRSTKSCDNPKPLIGLSTLNYQLSTNSRYHRERQIIPIAAFVARLETIPVHGYDRSISQVNEGSVD